MLGPYINPRGSEDTKMSANADLITLETYVQQGKQLKTSLSYNICVNMLKYCIFSDI